jgi:hypothetical protein
MNYFSGLYVIMCMQPHLVSKFDQEPGCHCTLPIYNLLMTNPIS